MGLWDSLKGAVNAVTGGAAKVTLEFSPSFACPGDEVNYRITATSTGAEVKSKGVFIDLYGVEEIRYKLPPQNHLHTETATQTKEIKVSGDFVLAPNESKTFEGTFQAPQGLQPTFHGVHSKNQWQIRGRVEAFGNDPDSGYREFRIGAKM